jgi:hypothetical protein
MITDILKEYEQSIIQHKKNLKLIYESSDNNNQIIKEADEIGFVKSFGTC